MLPTDISVRRVRLVLFLALVHLNVNEHAIAKGSEKGE